MPHSYKHIIWIEIVSMTVKSLSFPCLDQITRYYLQGLLRWFCNQILSSIVVMMTLFCGYMQSIVPMLLRSLCRLLSAFIRRPAAAMTTLLHESNLLPHNLNLERFIEEDLLDAENYLFHFIINMLRCLWWFWKRFLVPEDLKLFFPAPIINWRFRSNGLFVSVVLDFQRFSSYLYAHEICWITIIDVICTLSLFKLGLFRLEFSISTCQSSLQIHSVMAA